MCARLKVEQWGPLVTAVGGAIAWWFAELKIPNSYSKELLGALLSAAAICAGFLTTALSILLPIGSTETGRRLRNSGLMPGVHRYLRSAILGCLMLAGVCVVLFFFLPDEGAVIPRVWSMLLVGNTMYAALALGRIAEVLLNLFERMSEPEDKNG